MSKKIIIVGSGNAALSAGIASLEKGAEVTIYEKADKKIFPYSMPPASKSYAYDGNSCPNAQHFLDTYIRWSSFCERYTDEDCDLATQIISGVADRYRK